MQSIKAINPDAVIRKVFLTPIIGTHLGPDSGVLCYVKNSPEKNEMILSAAKNEPSAAVFYARCGITAHKVGTVYVRLNLSARKSVL